jgi:hypothetical protein
MEKDEHLNQIVTFLTDQQLAQLKRTSTMTGTPTSTLIRIYNCMFLIMYAIGAGLFVGSLYFASVHVFGFTDDKLLALAVGFFLVAIAIAGWGMFRFGSMLPKAREQRRRQIQQGIKTIRDKLAR